MHLVCFNMRLCCPTEDTYSDYGQQVALFIYRTQMFQLRWVSGLEIEFTLFVIQAPEIIANSSYADVCLLSQK